MTKCKRGIATLVLAAVFVIFVFSEVDCKPTHSTHSTDEAATHSRSRSSSVSHTGGRGGDGTINDHLHEHETGRSGEEFAVDQEEVAGETTFPCTRDTETSECTKNCVATRQLFVTCKYNGDITAMKPHKRSRQNKDEDAAQGTEQETCTCIRLRIQTPVITDLEPKAAEPSQETSRTEETDNTRGHSSGGGARHNSRGAGKGRHSSSA